MEVGASMGYSKVHVALTLLHQNIKKVADCTLKCHKCCRLVSSKCQVEEHVYPSGTLYGFLMPAVPSGARPQEAGWSL